MRKLMLSAVFLGVSALLCLGGLAPAQAQAQGKAKFAGAESCKACHEDATASYARSIHGNKAVPGSSANRGGCESCHGAAAAHVEKSGAKVPGMVSFGSRQASAKEKNAPCLACHEGTKTMAFWKIGKHKSVSCDNCHTVHQSGKKNLKAGEPELCYSCHKDIRAQVNKRSHHPIKEGKVSCSDCHDSHGAFGKKMIKADTNNELCYKCHSEKRGPYMFEHLPVEENCMNCHTPHGSNHAKLLNRKTPQLCQSCHDWTRHPGNHYTALDTFASRNQSKQFTARDCMNCHSTIHGSNGPSTKGLRFVR